MDAMSFANVTLVGRFANVGTTMSNARRPATAWVRRGDRARILDGLSGGAAES